jgi:methylenetetrahydrofolate dehydrogenase (NADP+)/methenyltetrahydrofolate cyclohydrolase
MKLIDGKMIAAKKLLTVKEIIENEELAPALAVVLVGNDPASHLYVKLKQKAAKEVGIELRTYFCEALTSRDEIVQSINFLNADPDTHGIIVQLPLPEHLNTDDIVNMIDPQKDADGFHMVNQEKFLADDEGVSPVFPRAIMSLIDSCGDDLWGKNATVLGKSDVFDRVMTHVLVQRGCKTQFIRCVDKKDFSPKEKEMINNAEIIVTAIGMPEFVSCNLIKDDAIVIDGGISKKGEKIVGDIAQKTCKDRNITLSPVPGGVGPVTIACLLENAVELAQKQREL